MVENLNQKQKTANVVPVPDKYYPKFNQTALHQEKNHFLMRLSAEPNVAQNTRQVYERYGLIPRE